MVECKLTILKGTSFQPIIRSSYHHLYELTEGAASYLDFWRDSQFLDFILDFDLYLNIANYITIDGGPLENQHLLNGHLSETT